MEKTSLIYTNDKCVGCNKCIMACCAMGACVSVEVEGRSRIVVDGERCVLCGACLDACPHGAREFHDDTERFFHDLEDLRLNARDEGISLLVAPSFKANYPEEYEAVLGGLKQLGVNRIINVAFGADISTWGYLQYIRTRHLVGGISQPCPVVVSYIEHYLPELLPKLFPIQSPMMCAAIYARTQLGITDRFAFIGPCIGKKLEVDDPDLRAKGNIHYNVTFSHLMPYVREHNVFGPPASDELEFGVGSFYPAPGGLAETLHWFLGDEVFIREVCGEKRMYQWLHQNAERILGGDTPYLLIDALNCQDGCLGGTGAETHRLDKTDDGMFQLLNISEGTKRSESGGPFSKYDTPQERLANYDRQFAHLKLEDYLRTYTDRSAQCPCQRPEGKDLERIFKEMRKETEASRHIDCSFCGYETCLDMAAALYNGFNNKHNCLHYEKKLVSVLEEKSSTDLLTGLLNKISFEENSKAYLRGRAAEGVCTLCIIDFDNFKRVNDQFGHLVGDGALEGFARILRNELRGGDIIGRVGGDEFMALLRGPMTCVAFEHIFARIAGALRALKVENATGFSCSVGAVTDKDSFGFARLYSMADDALYEAKARGKDCSVRWCTERVGNPGKPVVCVASDNPMLRLRTRTSLGNAYAYVEAGEATVAFNKINLYQEHLERIYMDFDLPGIRQEGLRAYIRSRPIFSKIQLFDAASGEPVAAG